MVSEQRLSCGLRERLEFALRVAKAREWAGARNFSIVLDETFAAWDDAGRDGARNILAGLAEQGGQVILLSHDARFAEWAQEVIRLGEPRRPGRDAACRAA
jgi:DNA repair exonuclease SbcCD ATPase subunit